MTEEQAIESQRRLYNRSHACMPLLLSGICVNCGDIFWTTRRHASHCSKRCTNRNRKGEKSHWWRGGIIRNNNGYVKIYAPDHPAVGTQRYICEHRLAMEKHLGRYLKSFENIHHKNGIKNDNRIENLELWVRPQAAGQRVSDLIQWICENYADDVKKYISSNMKPSKA